MRASGLAAADVDAAPLSDDAFADLLTPFTPFEHKPKLAIAVSGGGDSMALCLLAHAWARRRGGDVVALTVDHGLRQNSADEALIVRDWLAAHGIDQTILRWRGAKPTTGILAAARDARSHLLEDWCRTAGVMHLLLGHHLDDQAETIAMRRERKSGSDGLAGMPPVTERRNLRLLRPLLSVGHERLAATLVARDQPCLDDPSNRDPRFRRARLRLAGTPEAEGDLALAGTCGLKRLRADNNSAAWLASWARPHPAGFVCFDIHAWRALDEPLARRILSHCITSIGGQVYPPRGERLTRLADALRGSRRSRSFTLGGCLINPQDGRLTILREPGAVALPMVITPGGEARWDGRFRIRYLSGSDPLIVGALGEVGWRQFPDVIRRSCRRIPGAARRCLPAVRHSQGGPPVYMHHVGVSQDIGMARICTQFAPMLPLSGPAFGITSLFPTMVALS